MEQARLSLVPIQGMRAITISLTLMPMVPQRQLYMREVCPMPRARAGHPDVCQFRVGLIR